MNHSADHTDSTLEVKPDNIVHLPLGLLGFEDHKQYVLLAQAEETPFLWLQMLEAPHQAFLVIPPTHVSADYQPELGQEDVEFLGLEDPEDAWVLNIVTLRPSGEATVNLKGPIVLNRKTLKGKQVIPLNATEYTLRHPLGAA
jgi:flagellar assembly factor FliW